MFWPGGTPWPMMDVNRWSSSPPRSSSSWYGRRFLVAALRGARHGEANMNTLVAIGTLSAYVYCGRRHAAFPHVGMRGGIGARDLLRLRRAIIALILSVDRLQARAKGQAGRRDQGASLASGPRPRGCVRDGGEVDVPVERGRRRRPRPRAAGRAGPGRRRRRRRHVGRRRVDADRRVAARRRRRPATRSSAPRSTPTGASSSGRRASAATRPWRRSSDWSRRPRARRRRSSASPTGSPESSCRS